ncbi:hypothetical protein BGW37DRAFT_30604 [Umbelopsis sp. PMI_123]|nr:hypothetical protein BGW37DRAFT_30604 [Umbelopsis sp. PMI_123]
MTEAPRRSRSRSANTTPRIPPQQAPIPETPPQMQGYPAGGQPQAQQPLPNQQAAAAAMNHQNMQEGPAYPNTPYMQQQQMGPQQGERGIFSGFRRKMREAAGFINTDPYSERAYGPQMMPPPQQPMQHGYGNGAASPGAYAAAQQYAQQAHMPPQNPQMMQQQYMQQHNPQFMGATGNPYAHSMGYAQTPVMMQQQAYGGMAYPYGHSNGYYNRGSYPGAYSSYGQAYGGAYGGGYGAGAYGGNHAYGGHGSYGMGGYPYSYGYGGGAYMGYPRQVPIYDEHGKRIFPEHNYVSSVKDLWSSDHLL